MDTDPPGSITKTDPAQVYMEMDSMGAGVTAFENDAELNGHGPKHEYQHCMMRLLLTKYCANEISFRPHPL